MSDLGRPKTGGPELVLFAVVMLLVMLTLADLFGGIGDRNAGRACNDRGGEYVDTTNGYVCIQVRRL